MTGPPGLDSALELLDNVTDLVRKLDILNHVEPSKAPPRSLRKVQSMAHDVFGLLLSNPNKAAAELISTSLGNTNVHSVAIGALETGENSENDTDNPNIDRDTNTASSGSIYPLADPVWLNVPHAMLGVA